jgi:DNA-binding transcriptional ArsR family regulator
VKNSETPPRRDTAARLVAAASRFELLSVSTRLHVVCLLAVEQLGVAELAARTGSTIPATRQQLAKLRNAGVIGTGFDGRRNRYRVTDSALLQLVEPIMRDKATAAGNRSSAS